MEGVIFDFNGVLWWDRDLQDRAWKAYANELRGWPLSDQEMDVHVHGRNNRYTLEYLLGEEIFDQRLDQLSENKETVYRDLCLAQRADFRLSPGAVDLLDFLVERGIPRTIATASAKPNVDFFIHHLQLQRWFDVKMIVYDDGRKAGKPAPDFFLQAASNLGIVPEKCVIVEDSRSGLAAASSAGIGTIIALGPLEDHQLLAGFAGVTRVIKSLADFPRELFDKR